MGFADLGGDEWVSLREFARRKDVNVNAVQQALDNGRIQRRKDKKIHWPSMQLAWDQLQDLSRVRDEVDPEEKDLSEFHRAKLRREDANATLLELKVLEAQGELVRAAHVKNAMTEFAIEVRDSIMTIPARVSSELAAELKVYVSGLDVEEIRSMIDRIWKRESRVALESVGHVAGTECRE